MGNTLGISVDSSAEIHENSQKKKLNSSLIQYESDMKK
jgi:hypothetical protein